MKRVLVCLGLGGALAGGCATLSESQCLAEDWETIGYSDGAKGRESSRLLRHQEACASHGVIPDREAYIDGWEAGVEQYCQPANGFSLGESGKRFSNVCPPDLQPAFHSAFQDGRRLHDAHSEIERLDGEIDERERELAEVSSELEAITAGLLDGGDDDEPRTAKALLRARKLSSERGRLESEIEALRVERVEQRARLAQLRRTLGR